MKKDYRKTYEVAQLMANYDALESVVVKGYKEALAIKKSWEHNKGYGNVVVRETNKEPNV